MALNHLSIEMTFVSPVLVLREHLQEILPVLDALLLGDFLELHGADLGGETEQRDEAGRIVVVVLVAGL